MAKSAQLGEHALYVAGYDLSGDFLNVQTTTPRQFQDHTAINNTAMVRTGTLTDSTISGSHAFNDATNAEHDALKALPSTDVNVIYQIGSTLGDDGAGLIAKQANYDWTRPQDGSFTGTTQFNGANGVALHWGEMLTAGKVTQASSGSLTGNVTAQSTNGLRAYLQLTSLGSGTPTFLVEDSSDTTNGIDGAWSTVVTFDASAAPGTSYKTATGTVEKGLRVTSTGTFTNADIVVVASRNANGTDLA